MREYSGCEPLVGEVVGLRTFRVDESGMLLPLYSDRSWYDGVNVATCAPPTGEPERHDHQIASPGCQCGFYAFGSVQAASRQRHCRYVQAVVSCWGSVVAGTQGVRAENARIEAIWLGPRAPAWLVKRVALTYPSARIYGEHAAMLLAHPLSVLPCYAPPRAASIPMRAAASLAGVALVGLGLVPSPILHGGLRSLWLGVVMAIGVLALWLLLGSRRVGHTAAGLLLVAAGAWFAAPLCGLAGWVLRLPVLRAVAVGAGGYLVSLRPGYFPIVRAPSPRRFRGVIV
jgi:hypothetical protein